MFPFDSFLQCPTAGNLVLVRCGSSSNLAPGTHSPLGLKQPRDLLIQFEWNSPWKSGGRMRDEAMSQGELPNGLISAFAFSPLRGDGTTNLRRRFSECLAVYEAG